MAITYSNAIDAAIATVLNGKAIDLPPVRVPNAVGRPNMKRTVNNIQLDPIEYNCYLTIMEFWESAQGLRKTELMTDEQFVSFMKAAAPMLNKRMIDMALVSDDLKAVRQVAADLADRGYGRAASQININVGMKDVRTAWKQLEQSNIIDVTNMIASDVIEVEDNEKV